jgi:hypothetical protein
MKTLLLEGNTALPNDRAALDLLRGLASRLIQHDFLGKCLAVLPPDGENRAKVLNFLQELKQSGEVFVVAVLRGAGLTRALLAECRESGLDQVVILQGIEDAMPAIDEMRKARAEDASLIYRLWLDPAAAGVLHARARAWEHFCPTPETIELAPFSLDGAASDSSGSDREAVAHACDWRRGVITLHGFHTLLPCPAHARGIPLDARAVRAVAADPAASAAPAGSNSVCGDCHRLARFAVPEWMWSSTGEARSLAAAPAAETDDELSCGDLGQLATPEREQVLARWLARVAASAEKESRP